MISSYISHLLLDVGLCVSVYSAWGFPGGSVVKNLPANAGAMDSIPGWGRSPGEGNGYPLQYSCLENPMDRETWGGYSPRGCKELDMTFTFNFKNTAITHHLILKTILCLSIN